MMFFRSETHIINEMRVELTFSADDNDSAPATLMEFETRMEYLYHCFVLFKYNSNSVRVELTFSASDNEDTPGTPISLQQSKCEEEISDATDDI